MIRNEKGVIYPITFCIFILFILFFLVMIQLYVNKKHIFQETKAMYRQEYYFMSTVKDLEKKLSNGEEIPETGQYNYFNTTIDYTITKDSPTVEKVEYSLLAPPNYRLWALSYYDKEKKKMTKWVEVNK
ncbi:competence type IV pilus minor pilin ComGG [Niallia sp. 01092]|uniref:competence type IV pilus minor pilin ComGG n=1 Tax=unclassified Niallia TaxID=2837522 RepID=UPI003FD351E6